MGGPTRTTPIDAVFTGEYDRALMPRIEFISPIVLVCQPSGVYNSYIQQHVLLKNTSDDFCRCFF